jgi:mono/diheme cytochrome c family protein
LRLGFRDPHSYRGYYHDLAFELAGDVTVGEMLGAAESAMGATFQGWKGGDYTMKEYTEIWLVTRAGNCGESIGAVLLEYILADVSPGVSQ